MLIIYSIESKNLKNYSEVGKIWYFHISWLGVFRPNENTNMDKKERKKEGGISSLFKRFSLSSNLNRLYV